MPARAAIVAVLATVVAPGTPRTSAGPRSRTPSFSDVLALRDLAAGAASSRPTRTSPSSTAIVAGTAPSSRTAASISPAIRRLSGRGSPWARIVDSSATTGRPSASAAATSSAIRTPL